MQTNKPQKLEDMYPQFAICNTHPRKPRASWWGKKRSKKPVSEEKPGGPGEWGLPREFEKSSMNNGSWLGRKQNYTKPTLAYTKSSSLSRNHSNAPFVLGVSKFPRTYNSYIYKRFAE